MKKPTLSVILASHNYEKYIRHSLKAILQQSYQPFEILIIEDASTDNSLSIIQKETKDYPNVTIISHAQNKGILYVINEAFSLAKGDFIYGAAADDIICPGFFEKSMNLLERHSNVGVLCTNIKTFFDENPSICKELPIQTPSRVFPNKEYVFSPLDVEKIFRQTKLTIHGQSCMYKRNAVFQYGGFPSSLLALTDWYLAHKIALHEGLAYIPEPLVLCRLHNQTYSSQSFALTKRHRLNQKMIKAVEKESPLFQKKVKDSCLFIQLGIPMLISLLFYPKHWDLFPSLLKKKCKNLLVKMGF
jgi:glycosyltransferase involved in cell wall biosynthesis